MKAYEAERLMVCWDRKINVKNIPPTPFAALHWLGGALFQVKHRIQDYLLGRFYVLISTSFSYGNLCKLMKLAVFWYVVMVEK